MQLSGVQRCAGVVIWHVGGGADDEGIDSKIVYRRYASLFFIAGCNSADNELITLEIVHRYVEAMDKYYGMFYGKDGYTCFSLTGAGNVCELDIVSLVATQDSIPN